MIIYSDYNWLKDVCRHKHLHLNVYCRYINWHFSFTFLGMFILRLDHPKKKQSEKLFLSLENFVEPWVHHGIDKLFIVCQIIFQNIPCVLRNIDDGIFFGLISWYLRPTIEQLSSVSSNEFHKKKNPHFYEAHSNCFFSSAIHSNQMLTSVKNAS